MTPEPHPSIQPAKLLARRGLLKGASALTAGLLVGGCGGRKSDGSLLSELQEGGSIKVGFANEAPYVFKTDQGKLTGQSVEVAREILHRLGIDEMQGVLTDFKSLIPGLKSGNYDMVTAGMGITPERCQEVLFSDPDYCAPQTFLVKRGNPLGLSDYDSVVRNSKAKIAVLQGGIALQQVKAAGVPSAQLTPLPSPQNMLAALQAGRVNAVTLTTLSARHLLQSTSSDKFETTPPFTVTVDGEEQPSCGGYVFRTEDQKFRDKFNVTLNTMQEKHKILPIVKKFGFTKIEIGAARGHSAKELCAD